MKTVGALLARVWGRLTINASAVALLGLAVMWGPLMGLSCVAIEYGHALKVRSELQDAADAAAEAGARRLVDGDAAVALAIRTALDARLRYGLKGIGFVHSWAAGTLDVEIRARVATRLAAMFGKTAFSFHITGSADLAPLVAHPGTQPAGTTLYGELSDWL